MSKLYWIGPRESDIRHTGEVFAGSITLYGSGSGGNRDFCSYAGRRINHNIVTEEQIQFIYDEQIRIIENPDARFMSYNPILCYESPDVRVIKERTDCLNSKELLQELENKRKFRELAGQTVKVLQSRVLKGRECDFETLAGIYNFKADSLGIIQKIEGATGGYGTYLLSRGGTVAAESILPEEDYLVSEYLTPNVPINLHAVIYEKDIVILPPSIQLIHQRHGRMLYFGGDYIAYSKIDAAIDRKFKEGARELCSVLKDRGYRGILGLDAIIYNGDVLFLEINPRFQGSSPDLNRALWERGCPSLQELNLQAFDSDSPRPGRAELESLSVYYGSFYFGGTHKEHLDFVYRNSIGEPTITEFIGDGCDGSQTSEEDAHQFVLQFTKSISSPYDGNLRIHQNLLEPTEEWQASITELDPARLKIALLNQGARISSAARHSLAWNGGMREGVYHSLDLGIGGRKYNAPLGTKLAPLSPFEIDCNSGAYFLRYYGRKIAEASLDMPQPRLTKLTKGKIPVDRICFLATDRVRIQNSSFCTYVEKNVKCRFCEAIHYPLQFDIDDVLDAIDELFLPEPLPFRHIMIGGLSNHIGEEKEPILRMCDRIRQFSTTMPIYLMSLPPEDVSDIDDYIEAGVREFGFNLEVFDRGIAGRIMPGKGRIPLEQYDAAFKYACGQLKEDGQVYTAFVVGLEPEASLLEGIDHVCAMGVRPILSPFLTIPQTPLQDLIPLTNAEIGRIYDRAVRIAAGYGLELGPDCPDCRNNVLYAGF